MKVKVCGLKYPKNVDAVAALAVDYMGFIFYDRTPRFVSALAVETLHGIPSSIEKTAVFVNEDPETIFAIVDKYGFTAIQLHGNESPGYCELFKNKVKVIKAFGVNSEFDFELLNDYANKVDLFLFDTKTTVHGGSGKAFDWTLLERYSLNIPFFLSGGIGMENLEEVKKITHQQFYGIDLNSKFEIEPGLKDVNKLKTALKSVKQISI